MSRWFLIFLTSLLIVLGARYSTYSPLPTAVFTDCETPVAETKLQGLEVLFQQLEFRNR